MSTIDAFNCFVSGVGGGSVCGGGGGSSGGGSGSGGGGFCGADDGVVLYSAEFAISYLRDVLLR